MILKIEKQVKRHVHSTIYSLFISAIPEEVGSKMPREIWEKVWRFTQTPYDELHTYNAGLRLGLRVNPGLRLTRLNQNKKEMSL